ncbi:5'-nucleotidase surE [Waddlia chondrophila 2032/99]|uniref:5'-nucleotidase SurE n=1 Tax=Waddlia chondrophila 2032/99 TaxID=765953 RepID=F8LA59_9BACT|nr:5'-nucleotidase surE [Waddlia chondrophila 2032/99]
MKPKVLITNDDGINAPGIRHLWQALKDIADATVVAPMQEQSATSLSITLRQPLMIQKQMWNGEENIYSVTGTPADCVKMGISVILEAKPDIVVSGINRGTNAGRNLLYSGTVAGCIEAALHGLPAIAFSCLDYQETDYITAQKHVPGIFSHILKDPLPKGSLLNVNFPSKKVEKIKGYKMTRQGKGYWRENPEKRSHPAENHTYYWLGARLEQFEEPEDSDVRWLKNGYITAVPVHVDELTDHEQLRLRRDRFENIFTEEAQQFLV